MTDNNPELFIARDVILAESSPLAEGHLAALLDNFSQNSPPKLHVTVLPRRHTQAISDKYPSDDPKGLITEALGGLGLPDQREVYITQPRVYGGKRGPVHLSARLRSESRDQIREDAEDILTYFGLYGGAHKLDPHITLLSLQNRRLAYFLRKKAKGQVATSVPITVSHPVVEDYSRRI